MLKIFDIFMGADFCLLLNGAAYIFFEEEGVYNIVMGFRGVKINPPPEQPVIRFPTNIKLDKNLLKIT